MAGVQLRLSSFTTGPLDPRYFSVDSTESTDEIPTLRFVNMYAAAERRPSKLSAGARETFETIVGNHHGGDRALHLVVLQDVFMTFYEPLDSRTWQRKTISTGGLSFPGYMYGGHDATSPPRRHHDHGFGQVEALLENDCS